jgi:outer membrane autotransporter protein
MSTEPKRTCPICGNEFSGAMEFCPVCMLRKGLAGGVESGESSSGDSEHGSLAPLNIHSQSAESLRTDFGFRTFYPWQVGKVVVIPSLRAAWEHEYKYSALPITAGFAGIPEPTATFFGPSEGHDSAIVSAGISVHWTPAIATYVNYDGQLGRGQYDSNAVTGGVRISF